MSPFEQSTDIEEALKQASVPQIDVRKQVMTTIRNNQIQRESVRVKKKVMLIVAACLVFGVTSAYGAIKIFELKNDKGEVVVQINKTENAPVLDHRKTYMEKINKVRESLKPNTAVVVYVATDNPNKKVSLLQKPITSEDRTVLQKEAGNLFTYPSELAGGYLFKSGFVEHLMITDYDKEALYKEAEQTKQDVVIKELKVDPFIQRLGATYEGSKGKITLAIDNFENMKYVSSEAGPDDIVEKVKVRNVDALYFVQKSPDETEFKRIEFYIDGTKLLYTLTSVDPSVSKEDLLAIAQQLK